MLTRHAMAFALMVALAGCADLEPPIDVETYDEINRNFNVRYVEVHITSTVKDKAGNALSLMPSYSTLVS